MNETKLRVVGASTKPGETYERRSKMITVTTHTRDKEDFMSGIHDGDWIVTKDNQLIHLSINDLESDYDVKAGFLIYERNVNHTTDWLRLFCTEHHPEVDFDVEFETNQPGIFGRYNDKYGYDYVEYVNQEIYNRLKQALADKGYKLPWD